MHQIGYSDFARSDFRARHQEALDARQSTKHPALRIRHWGRVSPKPFASASVGLCPRAALERDFGSPGPLGRRQDAPCHLLHAQLVRSLDLTRLMVDCVSARPVVQKIQLLCHDGLSHAFETTSGGKTAAGNAAGSAALTRVAIKKLDIRARAMTTRLLIPSNTHALRQSGGKASGASFQGWSNCWVMAFVTERISRACLGRFCAR